MKRIRARRYNYNDGSTNLLLYWLLAPLFRLKCRSELRGSGISGTHHLKCSKLRWHAQRHQDEKNGVGWCYGDDYGKF